MCNVLLTLLVFCVGIKQIFIEELVVLPRGKRYTILLLNLNCVLPYVGVKKG